VTLAPTYVVEPDERTARSLLAVVGRSAVVLPGAAELQARLSGRGTGPSARSGQGSARPASSSPTGQPAPTPGASPTVVLGPGLPAGDALALARELAPAPVVLVSRSPQPALLAEALRAGVAEVVAAEESRTLREVLRRLAGSAVPPAAGSSKTRRGRVVTVFSAKGGSGKTTLALNLAATLATPTGGDGPARTVCLVDLDLSFGDVAVMLSLLPARTAAELVRRTDGSDAPLDRAAVQAVLTPYAEGISVLAAPVEPGLALPVEGERVAQMLDALRSLVDYVIVDTPAAFTDATVAALDAGDVLALVTTMDVPALKNLKVTLETLDLLGQPPGRRRVVLNRADSQVGLALSEVEGLLGMAIAAQVPSSRAVPASVNRGIPLALDAPDHPVSLAVRAFAEQHVLPPRPAAAGRRPLRLPARRSTSR